MWCDGLSCRHDRSLIIDHRCVHLWIDQSRSHNSVCTRHTGLQKWMCWCGLSCIVFSCSRHDWCGCPRKCLLIDGIKHARMSRLLLDSQYCFISIGGLYESVYSAGIGTIFLTFWCWNPRQKDFSHIAVQEPILQGLYNESTASCTGFSYFMVQKPMLKWMLLKYRNMNVDIYSANLWQNYSRRVIFIFMVVRVIVSLRAKARIMISIWCQ